MPGIDCADDEEDKVPFLSRSDIEHVERSRPSGDFDSSSTRIRVASSPTKLLSHIATFLSGFLFAALLLLDWRSLYGSVDRAEGLPLSAQWTPLTGAVKYVSEAASPDYWSSELYAGDPSSESERAWNEILHPHGFRLSTAEAARLNIAHSIPLADGDVSSTLGVSHNLHCLRRLRQWLHADHYYPNMTEEERNVYAHHNVHCIESLRKALMCHPDLTIYPYYWTNGTVDKLGVGSDVPHRCVDWTLLLPAIKSRGYSNDLLLDEGRTK